MTKTQRVITIDGPVASGKSTIARKLAQALGYQYVYSGLLYRAAAYMAVCAQVQPEDLVSLTISQLADTLDLDHLSYQFADGHEQITYAGDDITVKLHTAEIDDMASRISALPAVRTWVHTRVKQIADDHHVVIDGRDAGSLMFPDADLKIYLTASEDVRARRWQAKQHKQGNSVSFEQALAMVAMRDKRDMERVVAPLVVPDGAVVVHNDGDQIALVVERLRQLALENSGKKH